MSTSQTLEIYKVLQKYFKNEEDAYSVVSDLEKIIDKKFEEKKSELASKQDLNVVKQDLKQDLNDLKIDLVTRIETSKTDTIKWMFIFWIGQLAATAGIIFAFLNAFLKK